MQITLPYQGVVDVHWRGEKTGTYQQALVAYAKQHLDVKCVLKQFGTWAVTDYGLECLVHYYPIERSRLREACAGYGWEDHMQVKRWVVYSDFLPALRAARQHHAKLEE